MGMKMGITRWEWEGIGTEIAFQLTYILKSVETVQKKNW